MITLSALKRVPQTGKHWDEAEGVKRTVRALRRTRKQFYLTLGELDPILRYKLRKQYGRTQAQRRMLTNDWVAAVTRAAFQVHTNDRLLTAKIRAGILSSLPGVGIPVSSAILAMAEPETYGIVDVLAWNALFEKPKSTLSAIDYGQYMEKIWFWFWAKALGWHAQRVEWCVWRLASPSDAA